MGAQLKRSVIVTELEVGGSVKAIADRIGITVAQLKKAAIHFNKGLDKENPKYINFRKKPTKEAIEFIDDYVVDSCDNISTTVKTTVLD